MSVEILVLAMRYIVTGFTTKCNALYVDFCGKGGTCRRAAPGIRLRSRLMTQSLAQHWALLVAGVITAGVTLFIFVRLVQDSARGRLAAAVGQLRNREKVARKAARRARKAPTTRGSET